jgi:hypothetical protein
MTAASVQAADFNDPEWPCVQRKVVNLSVGQMWAGPLISEDVMTGWREMPDVAALAPVVSVRRTTLEEAEVLIADFAKSTTDGRAEKLSALFAGAFQLIERERTAIISGIGRYARKQTGLSEKIDAMQAELADLNTATELDYDRIEELEDTLAWDTRIYRDRQQSLTYVCETPVILEKRAFALARTIMANIE